MDKNEIIKIKNDFDTIIWDLKQGEISATEVGQRLLKNDLGEKILDILEDLS